LNVPERERSPERSGRSLAHQSPTARIFPSARAKKWSNWSQHLPYFVSAPNQRGGVTFAAGESARTMRHYHACMDEPTQLTVVFHIGKSSTAGLLTLLHLHDYAANLLIPFDDGIDY
jgi:hypothetical protein